MADHNISNLVARYNGGSDIYHEPNEPGEGGWRYKANGDTFRADIAFYYSGSGGLLDIGIGLDYQPVPTWAAATMMVPSSSGQWVGAEVSGVWSTNIDNGAKVTVRKFVQIAGGLRDIGGNHFLATDKDDYVYRNVGHEFEIIDDENDTFYDGLVRSSFDHLGKWNGEPFTVRFPFAYRGPGGYFKFGAGLIYPLTWAEKITYVPECADWTPFYTEEITGTFNTNLLPGNQIGVKKMIVNEDEQLFSMGDHNCCILPVCNEDADVYYRLDPANAHECRVPSTGAFYRKNGIGDWVGQQAAHLGMSNGDTWEVYFTFQHKGFAGQVRAGIEINYSQTPGAEPRIVTVNVPVYEDIAFENYEVILSGIWDTDLPNDRDVSVIKFVENTDGTEYTKHEDPDDSNPYPFFTIVGYAVRFPDPNAAYRKNGVGDWIDQEFAYLGMRIGDTWEAKFRFQHKGDAGVIATAIKINYTPTPDIQSKNVPVGVDTDWTDYTVSFTGIWSTDLPDDRDVKVVKWVESEEDADWPFYTIVVECDASNPCPSGYKCVNGVCVPITVECTVDSDCAEGEICVGGYCFEDTGGEFNLLEWIKENALVISAVGIAAAGALVVTSKPKKK